MRALGGFLARTAPIGEKFENQAAAVGVVIYHEHTFARQRQGPRPLWNGKAVWAGPR